MVVQSTNKISIKTSKVEKWLENITDQTLEMYGHTETNNLSLVLFNML